MTLILRMKSKINNPAAPKLIRFDPIENRLGSMFLWDAGLAKVSTTNSGTVLPNLLNDFTNAANNQFSIQNSVSDAPSTDYIRTELTAKGGVHFIVSQNSTVDRPIKDSISIRAGSTLTDKLLALLDANPNLYVSVWTKHTRHVVKTSGQSGLILFAANNLANAVGFLQQGDTKMSMPAGASTLANSVSKLNLTSKQAGIVGLPNYYQFTINGYTGTKPSTDTNQRLRIGAGSLAPYSGTSTQALNACPSYIVYRIYIEDLKLSGRTFAEVKAIDDAEFEKAFSVGGRFYNDIWSDPATILP